MLNSAFRDFYQGLLQYRTWSHLGWMDIKQRYRRSVIGPWWISLSMLLFITMMGIVFSRLFHQSLRDYIPFFTAGYLFWTFISTSVLEAAEIFKSNGGFIKQINLPLHIYVFKHLVRQVICLLHNSVVYLLICIAFQFNPGIPLFFVLPGFALLLLNIYWISLLIAFICLRYRDMIPIITTCMQIAFLITPISWMPKLLDGHPELLRYNPLVYLLDLVRSPLLGTLPSNSSLVITSSMAIGGITLCLFIFSRIRTRIAFWVD